MAKLEPGQRAYEAWMRDHFGPDWGEVYNYWAELEPAQKHSWTATEQACAVPATAQDPIAMYRDVIGAAAAAVRLACGVDDANEDEAEQLRKAAIKCRDLGRVLLEAAQAAEAGKAQAEWTVCRHGYMPRAGEKVMFWCRGWLEGATPGVGAFNGDFWEDETQTENYGDAFKLIPSSEVTHWMPQPKAPPPSAPEGT